MTLVDDRPAEACTMPGCPRAAHAGGDLCAECLIATFPTPADRAEYLLMLEDRELYPRAAE